jgi:hypothetical protein
MAYTSAYDHVYDAPLSNRAVRPRAAKARVERARAAVPVMADPRLMELESGIGRSPENFPRGWYIVPGIVTLLAIGIAVIL